MSTDNLFDPRPEVRIFYNREWEEFRVYVPSHKDKDNGYYTTDAQDAWDQAQFMVRERGYRLVISGSARSRIAKITNN